MGRLGTQQAVLLTRSRVRWNENPCVAIACISYLCCTFDLRPVASGSAWGAVPPHQTSLSPTNTCAPRPPQIITNSNVMPPDQNSVAPHQRNPACLPYGSVSSGVQGGCLVC